MHQFDLETGRKVALDHALAVDVEDARLGESTQQGLAHPRWVGAALRRKRQCLGHGHQRHCPDHIVGELAGLTGAVRADMAQRLAHAAQHRPHRFKHLALAADHDRQRPGNGADIAAGDRRVEVLGAFFRQSCGIGGLGRGRDRTHVDDHRAGPYALDNPGRPE